METNFDLLTLALLPGVGPRALHDLRRRGSLADALRHPEAYADVLPESARARLATGAARRAAEVEAARAGALGIAIVDLDGPGYPALLREIYDPPPVLYVRGRLVEEPASIAIVGARRASARGAALARAMARDLAAAGVTIVSGLARGIDSAAHQGALDGGGRTVAVLGSGHERLYPRENDALAARVAEGGAVVSEFPLATEPHPGNFPRRNRVIAGWSRAVVVVEAAERSGALVTARSALDEGREVMAVPGHPADEWARGTNALIRDGAVLVRDAADVAAELGLVMRTAAPDAPSTDALLQALRRDAPSSLDDLMARSGRGAQEVLIGLTELELVQQVKRLPGALFIRN